MILLISKSVVKKILREISRLTSRYLIIERLKGKYGNNNADIEYWLKRLRSLKPKNKNKVIRKLGQAKEIFTEIEEIELAIANKEKLK